MMRNLRLVLCVVALATGFSEAQAASNAPTVPAVRQPAPAPPPATVPEPPAPPEQYEPPPAAPESEAPSVEVEPEVRIVTKGDEIHEEYRIHGQLYMIKVKPARGPAYYLIDPEGKGQFRRSDFEPSVAPPQWVLKRW
jgi:hypothetical protein